MALSAWRMLEEVVDPIPTNVTGLNGQRGAQDQKPWARERTACW